MTTLRGMLLLLALCIATSSYAQVLYLSPKIGDGSEANPFRAHQSGAWVDCTDLDTHMLCVGPSVPNKPDVVELPLQRQGALTGQQKAALAKTLGRPAKGTVEDQIFDVIDTSKIALKRNPDGMQRLTVRGIEMAARTAPLSSYIPDAIHAVDVAFHLPILVPDYIFSTAVSWAASLAETFTATDGDLDGCEARGCSIPWVEFTGTGWTIASNQASASANATFVEARANTALSTDRQWASATVVSNTLGSATTSACGVIVRKDNTTTRTFYTAQAVLDTGADGNYHNLGKRVAGTSTDLGIDNTDLSPGEILEARAVGDQISLYRNGVLLIGPTTDNSITTNTYTGVRLGTIANVGSCVLDNFQAADLSGSARRRTF